MSVSSWCGCKRDPKRFQLSRSLEEWRLISLPDRVLSRLVDTGIIDQPASEAIRNSSLLYGQVTTIAVVSIRLTRKNVVRQLLDLRSSNEAGCANLAVDIFEKPSVRSRSAYGLSSAQ